MPVTFDEILRRAEQRRQRDQAAQRNNSEALPRMQNASSIPSPSGGNSTQANPQQRGNIH